jgi:hypothetical protein
MTLSLQPRIEQEHLNFILSHFQEPLWPRTISTKITKGGQVSVYDMEEALAKFHMASFVDCRVSAYSSYTNFKGINRQAPNFIFIDIDRQNFKTERAHNIALSKTLKNIKERLGGSPTVLWSGNGYHIYQPIQAFVLEQEEIFSKFEQSSRKFMQFAEEFLSYGKCDYAHNITVSFKNCMLRIPGSINSKNRQIVKIGQRWNGYRPAINYLLRDFRRYLIDHKIKNLKHVQNKNKESYYYNIRKYVKLTNLYKS